MKTNRILLSWRWPLLVAAAAVSACDRGPAGGPSAPASNAAAPASGARSASAASSTASVANAAAPLVPASAPTAAVAANADTAAGRQIASQGAPGAAACSSCHGANGEGNAASGFPRIAALGQTYIVHQLNSYADGTRAHPIMTPIASALSPEQRGAVAAFYAGLGADPAAQAAAPAGSAPVLAVRGDEAKGVQGCVNCHGPQGIGDAGPNPYLAGQHPQYLAGAMAAWKNGSRHNDPSGQMPAIAKALSDSDTQALVSYYASLPPPAARNAQAAATLPPGNRAAVQSGPVMAAAAAQGTGTEQGAPLTGGAQGPAAGGAATNPAQSPNR